MTNITIQILDECNLQCKYCFSEKSNHSQILDLNRFLSFLGYVNSRIGVNSVTITGGEPLLYNNLKSLIKHIKEITDNIVILTNGTLLNKDFLEFFDLNSIALHITLDSMDEEYHNEVRSEHQKVLESIKEVKNYVNIRLTIIMVISVGNYDQINKIYEFSVLNKIDLDLTLLYVETSHKYSLDNTPIDCKKKVIEILELWATKYNKTTKFLLMKAHLLNKTISLNKCNFCKNSIVILPSGEVVSCFFNNIKFGTMNNMKNDEILSNFLKHKEECNNIDCYSVKCIGLYI